MTKTHRRSKTELLESVDSPPEAAPPTSSPHRLGGTIGDALMTDTPPPVSETVPLPDVDHTPNTST